MRYTNNVEIVLKYQLVYYEIGIKNLTDRIFWIYINCTNESNTVTLCRKEIRWNRPLFV